MKHATPTYIARKEVHRCFPGLSSKTLANQNSKGLVTASVRRGRLIFDRFDELKSMFIEERKAS